MYHLLLIAVVTGLGALFVKLFSGDAEFSEIEHDDIFRDFLIDQDELKLSESELKRRLTRAINLVVSDCEGFKIGKTGNPKSRTAAHRTYSRMFLLCCSADVKLIESLESHYNHKYILDKKNDNKKVGSAGTAKAVNGKYYLYIVTR